MSTLRAFIAFETSDVLKAMSIIVVPIAFRTYANVTNSCLAQVLNALQNLVPVAVVPQQVSQPVATQPGSLH